VLTYSAMHEQEGMIQQIAESYLLAHASLSNLTRPRCIYLFGKQFQKVSSIFISVNVMSVKINRTLVIMCLYVYLRLSSSDRV